MADGAQCQALNLSDSVRCAEKATVSNDLFCKFHGKQCYGLYRGYKRRNAQLDNLEPPPFLRDSKTALTNQTFAGVTTESVLRELHNFLFTQYVLLGKVTRARKLHQEHFYPLDLDYGHKTYLDRLVNQRGAVLRALENLGRRTAQLLYEQEQWFTWVKEAQKEEEAGKEKEVKKIKLEAAMFRRHFKEMQARMQVKKAKEAKKREEAFLEEAWNERVALEQETDDEEEWDPIEDVVEEDREKFLSLIRHFLWMNPVEAAPKKASRPETKPTEDNGAVIPPSKSNVEEDMEGLTLENGDDKDKKKKAKRGKKKKGGQATDNSSSTSQALVKAGGRGIVANTKANGQDKVAELDESKIESKDEVRKRLLEGQKKDYSRMSGPLLIGTAQNPVERTNSTAPLPEDETNQLLEDIEQIKLLLFCRQLLSHAALLPAAMKANSVEEFLNDPEIPEPDLRDLCLKVEKPTLQALRDACADFARGDEDPIEEQDEVEELSSHEMIRRDMRYRNLSDFSLFDHMTYRTRQYMKDDPPGTEEVLQLVREKRKTKVTVCGKTIWKYGSQSSMARAGWLQFSVMAKDCSFDDAIHLCRNWDEFNDLSLLAVWQFFPSSSWSAWQTNQVNSELLQQGFVPFYYDMYAREKCARQQVGGRSHGVRRQHHFVEARNIIGAYMKRNDPATRRFIQYILMLRGALMIVVRDGVTGECLTAPDEDQMWISRSKIGLGRASKNEWEIDEPVDLEFFMDAQDRKTWDFSFDSYYEVYIWDFVPGGNPLETIRRIIDTLWRARRATKEQERYTHLKDFLGGLVQEKESKRVRMIKPDETEVTLWEFFQDAECTFWHQPEPGMQLTRKFTKSDFGNYYWYNEADAAEDAVLFPDDTASRFEEIMGPLERFEQSRMPPSILNLKAKEFDKIRAAQLAGQDPWEFELSEDEESGEGDVASHLIEKELQLGPEEFLYSCPVIWEKAFAKFAFQAHSKEDQAFLSKMEFFKQKLKYTAKDLLGPHARHDTFNLEIMERDRSYVAKVAFHQGDLEPGSAEKYEEATKLVHGIQKQSGDFKEIDWVWFCLRILDSLGLKAHYNDYTRDPHMPWPSRYLNQDICQAFVTMGLFFPQLEVTRIVRHFLDSEDGQKFRNSPILDPATRAKTLPDRRTGLSFQYRDKSFWTEWDKLFNHEKHFADIYPMDWSLVVRPTIAKLYRAGVIEPAYREPHPAVCSGNVMAGTEPHRPGKLDMFIKYEWNDEPGSRRYNSDYISRNDWPDLLREAKAFAATRQFTAEAPARFALLRLWSAPHFYPLMITYEKRAMMAFMDSAGRSWDWKFVSKDMPDSEFAINRTVEMRLEYLFEADRKRRATGAKGKKGGDTDELKRYVKFRGDAILVMAAGDEDLLRRCTAVAFALQTKPWMREVDLWKSFINVDLEFLEGLDPMWLD